MPSAVTIRPLTEADLPEANRVFRLAFGTWLKLPDPSQFAGDSAWVEPRFRGRLGGAHAADAGGRLIGSNLTANRGSVGFFGPLTVDPAWWGKAVAKALVAAAVDDFTTWGVQYGGLFTFAESALHVGLYRQFGFWPGALTVIMVKAIEPGTPAARFDSYEGAADRGALETAADAVCGRVLDGLTVTPELRAVATQRLGDTIFVDEGGAVDGFAVCHCGAGSEAGTGVCRVKFAAATSAPSFGRLVDACEAFAAGRGLAQLQVGMNFDRERASRALLARGYRTVRQGVGMYRPGRPAYDYAESFVIDDWR